MTGRYYANLRRFPIEGLERLEVARVSIEFESSTIVADDLRRLIEAGVVALANAVAKQLHRRAEEVRALDLALRLPSRFKKPRRRRRARRA